MRALFQRVFWYNTVVNCKPYSGASEPPCACVTRHFTEYSGITQDMDREYNS